MDYINKVQVDGTDYILSNLTDGAHTVSLPELSADDEFALQSNVDAALDSKANKNHTHTISNVDGLQDALDEKANSSHGTHVTYSTTAPVMDGTASVGTASTVARSDHRHPVDTSRASQTEFDTHVSDNTKHITSTERTNWNAAKTHADSAHAPSNAEKNQNAFSNVKIGDGTGAATISAGTATDTLTLVAGNNVTIDSSGKTVTITSTDTNTKYSAGTGISLNGTTFSNSGVRSVATGTTNGTISVNTDGSSTNVAVKGLGTAAYTDVGSYDASGAADTALANAKTYADSAATKVKNDLLNGAGEAYDTLKELGDLIDENSDAIDALKTVASGKADKVHTHEISDVINLQTSLDGKQASITGGASTITSSNLTANRALVSNASGKVAISNVTSTELGYLDGVTSNIQTQLDGKSGSGHTHSAATTSASGFMTADMVTKLNGISSGANKTTVDSSLSTTSTNPVQNKVVKSSIDTLQAAIDGKVPTTRTVNNKALSANISLTASDVGAAESLHTHSAATTSADGFMSSTDKSKLDGIASGANKTTIDSALSSTSENPVQNKVINTALAGKLSTTGGTLTGNLTGKYLTGTWLQTTAVTEASSVSKIAVIDGSGWIYSRSLANLKTDLGVPTKTSQLTNDSGFLTSHQSLSNYALKSEIPTKTSQLTNDSGFLTSHQSLSGYATQTWVTSQIQSAIDATWEASY